MGVLLIMYPFDSTSACDQGRAVTGPKKERELITFRIRNRALLHISLNYYVSESSIIKWVFM